MLRIKKKTPEELEAAREERTATRKAEQVEKLKRGLEAYQEKELNNQIASASEKIIEECKRVLNGGIRDYINTAIERGWNEKFSERIEKAANEYFRNTAEHKKFPLMPFEEIKAHIDKGWRILDIIRCGTDKDGIWMQRFHRDRKEEPEKKEKKEQKAEPKKIKISIKRRS